MRLFCGLAAGVTLWPLLSATSALAHHVADGSVPSTTFEGLLSGIAHPVIEPGHLAFVVAIGIAAAVLDRGWRVAFSFIGAVVLGALLHLARVSLPLSEFLVAVSLVVAGAALVASRIDHPRLWIWLSGLAGLVHGYALAQSIIGATLAVTSAYIVGLTVGLTLLVAPIMAMVHWLVADDIAIALPVRAAGGAVAALGVLFAASALAGG